MFSFQSWWQVKFFSGLFNRQAICACQSGFDYCLIIIRITRRLVIIMKQIVSCDIRFRLRVWLARSFSFCLYSRAVGFLTWGLHSDVIFQLPQIDVLFSLPPPQTCLSPRSFQNFSCAGICLAALNANTSSKVSTVTQKLFENNTKLLRNVNYMKDKIVLRYRDVELN